MPQSSIAVGKAVLARLDFTQGEVEALKAKLLKLTEATVIVRSPQRDDQGRIKYVEVPDVGIQLAATVKALEFAVGKPTQKIMDTTPPRAPGMAGSVADLSRMLGKNPEIVLKIVDMMKLSQAIDVTATSGGSVDQPPESQSGGFPSEPSKS